MNRDEILRMARDSGMELYGLGKNREKFIYHLDAFADLIAAAEREACAAILDVNAEQCTHGGMVLDVLLSNAAAIRARGQE